MNTSPADAPLLAALRERPDSAVGLHRRTGLRLTTIVNALARLWAEGLVVRTHPGVYSATTSSEAA